MTYLKPCYMCPQPKPCELRNKKLVLLRPAKISSAEFRCPERLRGYEPGQLVEFDLVDIGSGEYGMEFSDVVVSYRGIIMRPIGRRVLVWVIGHYDGDEFVESVGLESGKNPVALNPSRIKPIEGRVRVATCCGKPEGTKPSGKSEYYYCYTCEKGDTKYE